MSELVPGSRRFIEEARVALGVPTEASDGFVVSVLLQTWREASAENERLRNVLGSCAGFIVSIRDDHTTDEWTEDAARRLRREIYAVLHPQEQRDE